MFGVGRDLCGSSSPIPLPKQGHLQQAAQDLVQAGLEYLQRRRLHKLRGQPVPGLRHPQREEVLSHVQLELPLLQFVPTAPHQQQEKPVSSQWEGGNRGKTLSLAVQLTPLQSTTTAGRLLFLFNARHCLGSHIFQLACDTLNTYCFPLKTPCRH